MKNLHPYWALLLIALTVSGLRAQSFQVLSESRYVSVSGAAGSSNGSTSYSNQQPASTTISGSVTWPDPAGLSDTAESSSSQTSFLGPDFFTLSSSLSASSVISQFGAGLGSFANATAISYFEVTFAVSSPITFDLLFPASANSAFPPSGIFNAAVTDVFKLSSVLSGELLNINPLSPAIILAGGHLYGGLLPGDVYTIVFSQIAQTFSDPFGAEAFMTGGFTFAPIPETRTSVLLTLGFTVFGLARLAVRIWGRTKTATGS